MHLFPRAGLPLRKLHLLFNDSSRGALSLTPAPTLAAALAALEEAVLPYLHYSPNQVTRAVVLEEEVVVVIIVEVVLEI